ncbi:group III truncated hemoglobin [Gimibacter soli]|uniref:Group III truncated hemoglobin n=1 Tax=Gimibacter soli TaxID=3024400 RepID=A0AAF0BJ52_9PROT|nr:group III truncated hemoglobin [Gimibacter soli]WCL52694.1 group III truncated hemoglobin [Gimibacter soli]
MTPPLPLTDEGLARLVDAFYARVRADDMIGWVFNNAISDWPHHLEQLSAFWSSVMLTSGRYKGRPMPAHMKHKAHIRPEMFDRWLALWAATTNELMTPVDAAELQEKATRIGESLKLSLFFRPEDLIPRAAE